MNSVVLLCRARKSVLPRQPHNRADLVLGPPWDTTADGRPLILVDDGQQDKLVILCTQENITR